MAANPDHCVALNCARGRLARKYVPLAVFAVAWAVMNMAVVDGAFSMAGQRPPYAVASVLAWVR